MGDAALAAASSSVTSMIAGAYMGEDVAPEEKSEEVQKFDADNGFDAEFQTKVAALVCKDTDFNIRTDGLVKPDHFENLAEATLVDIARRYFDTYKKAPDRSTFTHLISVAIKNKIVRRDMAREVVETYGRLSSADISDRDYVIDKVDEFARYQAVTKAILDSVTMLERKQFPEIEKAIREALEVGAQRGGNGYDYFSEIEARSQQRRDVLAGTFKPNGITTGIPALDARLHHKGWGRKELSCILGGAKAGKSTALINFGKSAVLAGYNVIHFTLEMSKEIVSERADASFSSIEMGNLAISLNTIQEKVEEAQRRSGKYIIHEFPTGAMRPSDIRRVLERHRAHGIIFDLIVIDYADIMAPEFRSQDPIANSKSVWEDIRAIAQEYDAAVLTATQTNRDGFKSSVAKAEHVAEDFNKVRIVDLMVSINCTEEERERNEARLYFAASRNQASNFTIRIQQNLSAMQFVIKVLAIE